MYPGRSGKAPLEDGDVKHVMSPRAATHALLLAKHAFASALVSQKSAAEAVTVIRTALALCTLSFEVCYFESGFLSPLLCLLLF